MAKTEKKKVFAFSLSPSLMREFDKARGRFGRSAFMAEILRCMVDALKAKKK